MKRWRTGLAEKILILAKLPQPAGNFLSLSSLAQLLDLPLPSARVAAKRLEKKNVLSHVGPALYANLLADPSLEQLASLLWAPSYLSLEWALAYHGLSTQKPSLATCVTLHRPRRVKTVLGTLHYSHLSKSLFFGFRKETIRPGVETWVAEPEKALLDWIYLRRRSGEPVALDEIDVRPLRPALLKRYQKAFPAFVQAVVAVLAILSPRFS
jgi:predicted transcriptional regulator of viral defense system